MATLGGFIVLIYASQAANVQQFLSIVSNGILVAAASFMVGGFVGFLFGIPRTRADESQQDVRDIRSIQAETRVKGPYGLNTNLEDISDWLTKILVGIGLTQLAAIPSSLRTVARALNPALGGFAGSDVFALALFIYFCTSGFFIGFLWTRLQLPGLQAAAENQAYQAGIRTGERNATETFGGIATPSAVGPIKDATAKQVLWVDDKPNNNKNEKKIMERTMGIQVKDVQTTEEALNELNRNPHYRLILSDYRRPDDPQDGYTLLRRLREKEFTIPVIYYTGSASASHDAEARKQGAVGSTNSPVRLVEMVSNVINQLPSGENESHTQA
jgi:CheY-like chemotaxis protein